MHRRRFVGLAIRGGAAAALAGHRRIFAAPTSVCPEPPGAFPRVDAQGRKLIVPTDTPDRFNLKVMESNPIPAPDPAMWELEIGGLVEKPSKLRVEDLKQFRLIEQSSRLKCVQCWSARILWKGFRCNELLQLAHPKDAASYVRIDCADRHYDYMKIDDLLHPKTLFATGLNGEPLTPEHGAPLRLVIPFKYGYKSPKLITKITLTDHPGQGAVADASPYYSQAGDIRPGYDHPFDFPGQTRKIEGGEIMDY